MSITLQFGVNIIIFFHHSFKTLSNGLILSSLIHGSVNFIIFQGSLDLSFFFIGSLFPQVAVDHPDSYGSRYTNTYNVGNHHDHLSLVEVVLKTNPIVIDV